jgi:glycogen debranching enzyme
LTTTAGAIHAGGILFADGRQAEPPIAVSDHQGYAYDARMRMARLLRDVWDDEESALRLEQDAAALKERFNADFWDSTRRHYVLALEGEKEQVDALTSNIGHLLWSRIMDERRADEMVRRLMADDMFSDWGIRQAACPRQESNLRTRFRKPLLYPLSYGGAETIIADAPLVTTACL